MYTLQVERHFVMTISIRLYEAKDHQRDHLYNDKSTRQYP